MKNKVIAVSGEIAAGKTSLLEFFKKKFVVFYLDKIQNNLYQPFQVLFNFVKKNYPHFIEKNQVVKAKIKSAIIANSHFKKKYQDEVVAILVEEIKKIIKQNPGLIIFEIPYIDRPSLAKLFDKIIIIQAHKKTRIKRLATRDQISFKKAQQWVEAGVESLAPKALVIKNNHDLEKLKAQVNKIYKWLML